MGGVVVRGVVRAGEWGDNSLIVLHVELCHLAYCSFIRAGFPSVGVGVFLAVMSVLTLAASYCSVVLFPLLFAVCRNVYAVTDG